MFKWIRRLLWLAPEDRWGADIVFVLAGVFGAVSIGQSRQSIGVAFGVALAVVAIRHAIFFSLVKPSRLASSEEGEQQHS